jgi:hypothetical protein
MEKLRLAEKYNFEVVDKFPKGFETYYKRNRNSKNANTRERAEKARKFAEILKGFE